MVHIVPPPPRDDNDEHLVIRNVGMDFPPLPGEQAKGRRGADFATAAATG